MTFPARSALFAALLTALASPAAAVMLSGSVTTDPAGGSLVIGGPLPLIGADVLGTLDVMGFDERQDVVLPANLFPNVGPLLTAGQIVSSHLLVFDPASQATAVGEVLFNRQIVAFITGHGLLQLTSALFGAPGTVYDLVPQLGLELGPNADSLTVDPTDRRRLFFRFQTASPGDVVRVLTFGRQPEAAVPPGGGVTPGPGVPEPATWAMLIAGFGFVGAALRRRRAALV
jgi:hypothetical protein